MVLISEVGAVQTTVEKNSTKRKKATSYHYPDDIIKVIYVVNSSYCSEESTNTSVPSIQSRDNNIAKYQDKSWLKLTFKQIAYN